MINTLELLEDDRFYEKEIYVTKYWEKFNIIKIKARIDRVNKVATFKISKKNYTLFANPCDYFDNEEDAIIDYHKKRKGEMSRMMRKVMLYSKYVPEINKYI